MYSTTTIVKNSKFSGKIIGTHQQLDRAARRTLTSLLPRGRYFPTAKEIIYFEGTRGPDGLKRKSPGIDEPSHMMPDGVDQLGDTPSSVDHGSLDERSVWTMIVDHRWNLIQALRSGDHIRAAFEAAWMAHMITDGLTPAHHFPLSDVKDELMTDKEMMRIFGQPIKGLIHGRNMLETLRNNWLYWGAGGHMSQHVAYEYGVAMLAAALPQKNLLPNLSRSDVQGADFEQTFRESLSFVQKHDFYTRFRRDGWTTELALETKDILLPEITKMIAFGWYSAAEEAYHLPKSSKSSSNLPVASGSSSSSGKPRNASA